MNFNGIYELFARTHRAVTKGADHFGKYFSSPQNPKIPIARIKMNKFMCVLARNWTQLWADPHQI